MNINDFVEMNIFLCLICFSICAKIQGFVEECAFFSFFFMQKFKMATKNGIKVILGKIASRLYSYPMGKKFRRNGSISHSFRDKCVLHFTQKFKILA